MKLILTSFLSFLRIIKSCKQCREFKTKKNVKPCCKKYEKENFLLNKMAKTT